MPRSLTQVRSTERGFIRFNVLDRRALGDARACVTRIKEKEEQWRIALVVHERFVSQDHRSVLLEVIRLVDEALASYRKIPLDDEAALFDVKDEKAIPWLQSLQREVTAKLQAVHAADKEYALAQFPNHMLILERMYADHRTQPAGLAKEPEQLQIEQLLTFIKEAQALLKHFEEDAYLEQRAWIAGVQQVLLSRLELLSRQV